ncbi:hypothetical protein COV19_07470 [Candidatus Woesearchaeota archaeon CG10_big_fil_rev_8_21_14_0_10_44_13]|nr:MAG: hypothetical protein COV19_07470 [Candidatus Woesearchaeota archaeon CG10_big_fil_rev_8_21_14_0_10_44_13]
MRLDSLERIKNYRLPDLRHFNPETRVLKMPVADAIELLLFIMFLAAALGAIFRQRFLYIIFGLIIVLMLAEGYRRKREKEKLEKKIDDALLKKRAEYTLDHGD